MAFPRRRLVPGFTSAPAETSRQSEVSVETSGHAAMTAAVVCSACRAMRPLAIAARPAAPLSLLPMIPVSRLAACA